MREVKNNEEFHGSKDMWVRIEIGMGSAQLQFKTSTGNFIDHPSALYTSSRLVKLNLIPDQVFRFALSGSTKVFRE